MPALSNRILEIKDETVQAFWKGIARLDKTVSPYQTFRKFHSPPLKPANFFLFFDFAWAVACVAVVRYFQAQPFPLLSALGTTVLVAVGLSVPMVRQFILPSTGILIYFWTLYWVPFFPGSYSITLPFHLSTLSYPLLSFVMWLFGPSHCVQFFSSLVGHTNVMVAMTYIALESTWVPPAAKLPFDYETIFAGLNTGLQALFLSYFFPQHLSFTALFCVLCILHGGLQEKLGFLVGVGAAVKCFFYFLPDEFRKNCETSPLLSSLFASNTIDYSEKKNHEVQDNAVAAVPVEVIELPYENCIDGSAGTQASTLMLSIAPQDIVVAPLTPCQMDQARENATCSDLEAIQPRHLSLALENLTLTSLLPYQLGKDGTTVTNVLEAKLPSTRPANPLVVVAPSTQYSEQEGIGPLPFLVVTNQERIPDEDYGRVIFPQNPPQESKPVGRRRSVVGPREHQKSQTSRRSLDVNLGRPRRQLPTPPHLPNQAANVTRFPIPSFLSSPVVQARWNDNLFEVLERLGESSSRITYKVREKRSGLCYVRKTFYSCQTSGDDIKEALVKLINCQEDGGTSLNVVRCYGVYLSSEGVRGFFEFCEEGSLRSIGSTIALRGGIVGEKIARRLAEGTLQGLSFLHGVDMVHLNVRPSNVFVTRLGIVKLSEPEIPGEGPVALTDRFTKSVRYASPERIQGNPSNLAKSDIWATGMTLLEFMRNRYPYPADLPTVNLMERIVDGPPPQLNDEPDLGITWSHEMKDFFTQCLRVEETGRPTAKELLAHSWILSTTQQNVRMDKWLREVWELRDDQML